MNYIETCTKIAVFLWRSSNYRPLTSVLHVRPGWIIYQSMRETWEKKVMKFEREIPIGLDARRKKWQGGAIKAPPPNGIRVKPMVTMTLTNVVRTIFYHLRNGQKIVCTTFVRLIVTKPLDTPTLTTIYQIKGAIPCLSCNCPPRTLRLKWLSAFAKLLLCELFSQIQAV